MSITRLGYDGRHVASAHEEIRSGGWLLMTLCALTVKQSQNLSTKSNQATYSSAPTVIEPLNPGTQTVWELVLVTTAEGPFRIGEWPPRPSSSARSVALRSRDRGEHPGASALQVPEVLNCFYDYPACTSKSWELTQTRLEYTHPPNPNRVIQSGQPLRFSERGLPP
jgi:hypothetical protein